MKHKLIRLILFGVIAFFVSTQLGGKIAADKKAVPPTVKDLTGIWIGFDSDELTFTRLDLRSDLTGYCARVSPADTILHHQGVAVYQITKWRIDDWKIEIEMVPLSNAFSVGYVKGEIGLASLKLTFGGPENGGWKEHPFLQPESRTMISNQETKEKIDEIEKR